MKRFSLLIIFSFLFSLIPNTTFAEPPVFTLLTERVENGNLVRIYENQDGIQSPSVIDIPDSISHLIENSNEPVIEAKKQLLTIYLVFDSIDRQKELDNVALYNFGAHTLTIDFDYKMIFKEQQRIAYQYAKKQQEKFNGMSKEAIIKELAITKKDTMSFSQLQENLTNHDEFTPEVAKKEAEFIEQHIKNNEETQQTKTNKHSFFKYFLIFSILIVVFGLVYVVLRKR